MDGGGRKPPGRDQRGRSGRRAPHARARAGTRLAGGPGFYQGRGTLCLAWPSAWVAVRGGGRGGLVHGKPKRGPSACRPPVGGPGPLGPLCGSIGPGLPAGGRASRVSPPHLRRSTGDRPTTTARATVPRRLRRCGDALSRTRQHGLDCATATGWRAGDGPIRGSAPSVPSRATPSPTPGLTPSTPALTATNTADAQVIR